jgi:soluble lytic murein transglycosylase
LEAFTKKKLVRRIILILLILAILSGVGYYFANQYWIHRYDDLITRHAKVYRLDDKLVWSVIYQETWFRSWKIGEAGEVGLMQITPTVAREWAKETGMKDLEKQVSEDFVNSLKEPERNIQIGCWYLEKLREKYRDSEAKDAMMLAAYNAGPSRVEDWTKDTKTLTESQFIQRVSIPSTNYYVTEILQRYKANQ